MLKLIYLIGFSLCVLVSSNPAYQRIPVWVNPQSGCPHNQNLIANSLKPIKPQSPPKGADILKTAITQDVVDKILENPVIQAIISPTGSEVKTPESSVINNYIIMPLEFLKLNDSINKIVSKDTGYKFIQTNAKGSKATSSRTKQQPIQYRNNNLNKIPPQMPQYQILQDTRPFEPNCYYPNNYQRCRCNNCNVRRHMQYKGPNDARRRQDQQKSRKVQNNRTKAKNTQRPKEEQSNRKPTAQKNNCLSDFDVEIFEDLGNMYDPKPIQRHCQSVDETNCIRDDGTHKIIIEKPVNRLKQSPEKNTSRNQNRSNKNRSRNDRRRTSSRDEAIIKNFVVKFPNIPEEIIRKVVHDVKKQLSESVTGGRTKPKEKQHKNSQNNTNNKKGSNQEVWQPPYYSTRPYESKKNTPTFSLAQHSKENTKGNRINNSREVITKDQNKVTRQNKSIEHLDNFVHTVSNDNIQTTTKSPTTFETTTQMDITTENLITTIKLNETTTESYIFREDGIKYPELGTEDVVQQVPNLIDDYFPNFRIDNKAHSLKDDDIFDADYLESFYQEDNYKKFGNNEATSRFLGNNEVKSRFLSNNEETSGFEDYVTTTPKYKKVKERSDIPFDSYSDESAAESAEIKFQTPPGLDKPNFLSKKINPKVLLNTEELNIFTEDYHYKSLNEVIGEQLSRYANKGFVSNSRDIDEILNEIQKEGFRDNKNENVETVYARSKVINYGNDNKENIESLFDETTQATIVLARSYPEDEFW